MTYPYRPNSHGQRRTADALVATLATRAGVLVMPEEERAATLARIRAYLLGRPETADGEFTLPMLTGVLRARGCERQPRRPGRDVAATLRRRCRAAGGAR